MLTNLLNAFGKVVDNLRVHNYDNPTLEYLKSVSVLGQKGYGMADVGQGKDIPGSELIVFRMKFGFSAKYKLNWESVLRERIILK